MAKPDGIMRTFTMMTLAVGGIVAASQAVASPLSELRWQARPLVVFAPEDAAPGLAEQRRLIAAQRDAIRERDMVVYLVSGSAVTRLAGAGPTPSARALRDAYGVSMPDRRVLLIGKDGGVKLRADLPVALEDIFRLIDSMPMRRREIRERAAQ